MEAPWRREGHSDSRCCVAAKRGTIKKMEDSPMKTLLLEIREGQGQHPRQGRAPVSCHQEPLRLPEGSLQGAGRNQAQLFAAKIPPQLPDWYRRGII
jgi:transposase, IS5 family